jgi:hypothetical protein
MSQVVKYLLEGLAVALASHLVAGSKLNMKEIFMLGLTAASVFMVLETYAPSVASGARHGAGFGIGVNMVKEGFDNCPDCRGCTNHPTGSEPAWGSGDAGGDTFVSGPQRGGDHTPGHITEPFFSEEEESRFEAEAAVAEAEEALAEASFEIPEVEVDVESQTGFNEELFPEEELTTQQFQEDANPPEQLLQEAVAPSPNKPYKLINGVYSHKALLAGYNENAKAFNSDVNCSNQASYPWGGNASGQQVGGAEGDEEPAESAGVVRDDNYRKADALYSGDLVDVTTEGKFLQRGSIDSQVVFDVPLAKVGTNLSKIRFVHPKHSATKQTPLNYGEPIFIMHNAYFNNMNQPKFVKYQPDGFLQSHQDGPLFRSFKVFDADNKDKRGPIEPGTEVYICIGDQDGDSIFLKVEDSKSVSSKSPVANATRFQISLKRVFEMHDRNLCVCPNELMYP